MPTTNLGRIGFVLQGDWVAGTYKYLDVVHHANVSWSCKVPTTTQEPSDIATDWARMVNADTNKADKVSGGTENNFGALDSEGNLKDSGSKAADFDTVGTAASVMSTHTTNHPIPTTRDDRNDPAGSAAGVQSNLDTHTDNVTTAHGIDGKVDAVVGSSLVADTEIAKIHVQNTDTSLDLGGANETAVADVRDSVDYTENQEILEEIINPTLDLDFENQVYKSYEDHSGLVEWSLNGVDSKLTFTRATTKTYFDAKGIMQTAAAGEIAIDYDPATGACEGFQPEAAATNLLEQSEDFSNAAWTKTRTSIGGDAIVVPDGSSVVCKLIEDTTESNSHNINQSVTISAGGTYTVSKFVKAGERSRFRIQLFDGADAFYAVFDLSSETVVNETAVGTSTILDSGIESLSNGWYRCWVSGIVNTTSTSAISYLFLIASDTTVSYTGDGTSGLYVWGAQLEAASAKSSYIPTTTEEVTRAADVMSMEGTDFSEWYRQGVGTVVCEFARKLAAASTAALTAYAISDGSTDNLIECIGGYSNSAQQRFDVKSSEVIQASFLLTSNITADVFYKIAGTYEVDDFSASLDGNAVLTDSSGSIPTVDRLHIGSRVTGGTTYLNGHIRKLQYYPQRLTNAQLIALSRS